MSKIALTRNGGAARDASRRGPSDVVGPAGVPCGSATAEPGGPQ